MKILTFPYLPKLQHYKNRNPPWLKAYAALLGPKFVSPREDAAVVAYAKAVWELSDYAKLLLPYLEQLAARHQPENQLPYNTGWIAGELAILQFAQRPRMLAATLDELIAVGLAEALDVTSIRSARHSPLARASAPLDSSLAVDLPREGSGEGVRPVGDLEAELPVEIRDLSEEMRIAVGHYDLAAQKAGWPDVRRATLLAAQEEFDAVTAEMRHLDPDFSWLVCFGRAAEQPFIADVPGIGFEWFIRRESQSPNRLNALKVWDYAFVSRRERNGGGDGGGTRSFGDFRDSDADFSNPRRGRSGYVLRWRCEAGDRSAPINRQCAFTFAGGRA